MAPELSLLKGDENTFQFQTSRLPRFTSNSDKDNTKFYNATILQCCDITLHYVLFLLLFKWQSCNPCYSYTTSNISVEYDGTVFEVICHRNPPLYI